MATGDVFRPLMKKLLIDNKHRVVVELHPDKALAAGAYTRPPSSSTEAVSDAKAHPKHP
jgi:hypothetical protein